MHKACSIGLLTLVAFLVVQRAQGQTLNELLVNEDPVKLIEQARESGDIVRGAILFHQGNTNCAKCHRPFAEKDRLGPDLSRMGQEVTDASIVESILQPSKTIKKGFETITILTVNGQTASGIIVSQDDRRIVLRSGQNIDQIVTIVRQDIDQMLPGIKSSMPDGLVNELKNRQHFLDLLRFVIDIRERGPAVDVADTTSNARRDLSAELKGWVLINKLNCVACHESATAASRLAAKRAPNLKWSSRWLNPNHLAKFIADPHQVKPGTSMPQLLGLLSESERSASAEAIVQYLVSIDGNSFQATINGASDRDAPGRGHEIFHTVGCVACHSPRDARAIEQPLNDSIPLGELRGKYDAQALTAFLENPHAARPSGRMPNMQLSHREALDVTSFLLQSSGHGAGESTASWKFDATLVEKGKWLFSKFACVKCHTGVTDTEPGVPTQLALEELDLGSGCLSGQRGDWPAFQFSGDDKQHIEAVLKSPDTEFTNSQQIDLTLATFNCNACHSRENFGGVSAIRSHHFQTTNLNLGEQGRIPPTLTGVGAKLNAKWMRDVLVNHRTIRSYMKTRMPQYGEQNIGHLIELLQMTDHLSETEFATFNDQKEMRKLGLELAGNRGLNCVACHTYQFKPSDTMPAVDLTQMAERLTKGWFYQYMLAPQKFSPNTVMPSYWPNGRAIRPNIPGDPNFQVEALWQYLLDGRQANAPQGVIREPLEVVVGDEAKMLRRSYEGVGKRGIGVGYPGGANLVYDAEQMRLAIIWKGKFADPSGVWYGQGHGMVRPLGRPFTFPKGPELDDRTEPWMVDDGRPPTHQFKGYVLDEARRPTFRYVFGAVEVEDSCSEFTDVKTAKTQLRRRITMISPSRRDRLSFRIAADNDIAGASEREFLVGQRLKICIVSDHAAKIVDGVDSSLLFVPLEFQVGQVDELVLEYLWE